MDNIVKSYLIAWFVVAYCTLYPNTRVVIASGTKGQANLIVTEKIVKDFMNNYPNVAREIRDVQTGLNKTVVTFTNGSTVECVSSTDNARGYRANILIIDEYRMVKLDVIKNVLRRFLATPRQPKYMTNPKYTSLAEQNKEIYLSSSWYKSHWSWDKFKSTATMMAKGAKQFCCALPYTLSVHHGLLTKEQIMDELTAPDFDSVSWAIEMEAMWWGENSNSYFKLEDIDKNRTLEKAFYPQENLDYDPSNKSSLPKVKGEIRIIGLDVALMKGAKNDNSIFTLMRIVPNGSSYQRQVVYMEHMNGGHSETQAIRLKQLYEDFEADYVVMDTQGVGMSVFDNCIKTLYDKERDKEYSPWTCFNDKAMAERCIAPDAMPVIYSMKVTSALLNHEIAVNLREDLKQGRIKLLANDMEMREEFRHKKKFSKLSPEEQTRMLVPFMQITILTNEMINLSYQMSDAGLIKIFETGSSRKDRYSSLAYCNYLARTIEKDLLKTVKKSNLGNYMFFN